MKIDNYTMLTDFYEITMANGYFQQGVANKTAYFDVFFRKIPEGGGYVIAAGLEPFIDYIENLKFTQEDIEYLKSKGMNDEKFLDYLRNFKFECDVWSVPEGTPVFPNEPIMTVRGPIIQAQFIETMTLLLLSHQTLIATKANRIVRAANGRAVMEFGSRRAHGTAGAILGARSAFIGGCVGTACTICEELYGIPALGTMAHSWVQSFDSEYEAFKKYVELYPNNSTLLVDTYDVLKSGVPNAIKVFKELNPVNKGIRIDSGDITYLSIKAREMLDEAGLTDCKIVASNSLDEYLIRSMLNLGARIDSFGVGERLITAKDEPVLGGVYKLVAVEDEKGEVIPKIKISENIEKVTNPGYKRVYRLFEKDKGRAFADYLCLDGEEAPSSDNFKVVDPLSAKHFKYVSGYVAKELLVPIYKHGELVYKTPSLKEIQTYCKEYINKLWPEVTRFENPHRYYVDYSLKLATLKEDLLEGMDK